MKICLTSRRTSGRCDWCGTFPLEIHFHLESNQFFCGKCCACAGHHVAVQRGGFSFARPTKAEHAADFERLQCARSIKQEHGYVE